MFDERIIPSLSGALGAGYEKLLQSLRPSTKKSSPKKSRSRKLSGGKSPRRNKWISHVKQYAKTHGVSYKEAMTLARKSWHH